MGKGGVTMIEIKKLDDYRRRTLRAVAAVRGIDTIERMIPVAFPVYKSTWNIRLRVEKSTGLVDRHILSVVKMFGPIGSAKIGELMGLEACMIENALDELSRVGVGLQRNGVSWWLPGETEIQHFYIEQTHEFGFLSNGITGDFLPLVQATALKPAVLDAEEIKRLHLKTIKHVRSSAEGELFKQIVSSERAHQFVGLGIPDGFVCFADKMPEHEFAEFVLAYMIVFKGRKTEIVSATDSAFHFDCPWKIAEQYLALWKNDAACEASYEGVNCRDEGNSRLVTVKDAGLWGDECRQGDPRERSVKLLRKMVYPGWTCDGDGTFHRLVPGDVDTARGLALRRGCALLRRSYGQLKTDRDIRLVAEEYREECVYELPLLKTHPSFAEVLDVASESSDGNVAEIARKFAPRLPSIEKEKEPTEIRFLHSQADVFAKTIVGAIDSSNESIMIMSPVLDEDGIFQAIGRARERGVRDIYVLTQLSEHRNNVFKTDPQFVNYELPRRKLAALGVSVRDCLNTVHAKMVVVDSRWLFVTSANMNANSLGVGKANAIEAAIEYRDTYVAKAGETLFWEVWNSACYRQVRSDDRISITTNSQARAVRLDMCLQGGRGYSFLLSTPENQLLKRKICAMIAAAKVSVDIISMSFYDLEAVSELFEEMMRALKRGVKLRVCVRPGAEMNFKPDDWPDPSTKKLQKAGLELGQCARLHAKGIIVDGKHVMMTSANFNPFSLGCSRTAHVEMAVAGTVELKPLAAFAKFAEKILSRR